MKTHEMETGIVEHELTCNGFHELLDWQIIQYREAVNEHRADLSKAEGRCVCWQDAEKDFTAHDLGVMSEKWRVEYCGLLCEHRSNCFMAARFMAGRETERVRVAG